ncbi:hypothetical protein [Acinetobacter nosocomialis]|uniref:hypothetical protein n=1 Tax=Acinetobacter nosocomialis TaxID=106654 RepID=UPI0026F0C19D|nr:hypothetical protein [Acinetobacter nosocomialis]MDO7219818.1 hypothetical protein [Acinetobacter nosocomialis]
MTIITLRDVETNERIIVRSIIDPVARKDKKGNIQIIQVHKWLYDESDDFVDEEFYGALNSPKVGMYVSLQYVIMKIEN